MTESQVVSRERWLAARKTLLAEEKAFTKARDALSARRRALPRVRVDKSYVFDGPEGKQSLAELFDGKGQLIVYHLMYAPEGQQPCKSCSFWADHFDSVRLHLGGRDTNLVAISRAPLPKLQQFQARMQWKFPWLSSDGSDFNRDYQVTFTPEEVETKAGVYNYGARAYGADMPGISVFTRDVSGALFHTYSCYGRGIDMLNGTYQFLDLVPKGRDEDDLPNPMSWVRYHDAY